MYIFYTISLFNLNWRIIVAAFMFLVFLGLVVALFMLMKPTKNE